VTRRGAFPSPLSGRKLNTGTSQEGGLVEDNSLPDKKRNHISDARRRADAANRATMKHRWADPDYQKIMSESSRQSWEDLEIRQRRSDGIRRSWADPKVREKRLDGQRRSSMRPEVRERRSAASKRNWANPELHKRHSEAIKQGLAKAGVRKHMSEAIKRGLAKPGVRKRMSSSAKRRVANSPGFIEKLRAARECRDNERRAKLEEAERILALHVPEERPIGRPRNLELGRRVRELRAGRISWGRLKVILDHETGLKRSVSTYRGYVEKS
jgi:hypothetical protein